MKPPSLLLGGSLAVTRCHILLVSCLPTGLVLKSLFPTFHQAFSRHSGLPSPCPIASLYAWL